MRIIGLTGGIGCGKSTASDYLNELGFITIDFDQTMKKLQEPGQPALKEIEETFGPEAILPDGTMNRKYVGQIVFSDAKEKEKLDHIMQKYLDEIVTRQTDEFREAGKGVTRETNPDDYLQKKVIFYDHPLLFEVPYRIEPADEAWVIDLSEEERIRRVMSRDHISREQIIQRMHSQMSRSEKLARADYVIDNSGTEEQLKANIDEALRQLDKRV
ncbi:MAG: dephospho-CoA kinase [Firmicutes bacterium]|nr:dephospho-CoA kinase [Bacillota bacterium]